MKKMLTQLSTLLSLFLTLHPFASAQITVGVEVLEGQTTYTTCTDPFDAPDPAWRVKVENEAWLRFGGHPNCPVPTLPYLLYAKTYNLLSQLPANIQVCFMAAEHDPNVVIFTDCTIYDCVEIKCESIPLPPLGEEIIHQITIPAGFGSGGYVVVRIFVEGQPLTVVDVPKCYDQATFSEVAPGTSRSNDMVPNDDGTFTVVGTWEDKAFAAVVDENGEVLQFENLAPLLGVGTSRALAIERDPSNGYAVAGEWVEITGTDTFTRVFLLRLDQNLEHVVSTPVIILGAEGIYQNGNRHHPVLLGLNDGYLLASTVVKGDSTDFDDIALTKYTSLLVPQWTQYVGPNSLPEVATDLAKSSTGFAVSIRSSNNSHLVRLSSFGTMINTTTFSNTKVTAIEYDKIGDKYYVLGYKGTDSLANTTVYRVNAFSTTIEASFVISQGISTLPADIVQCFNGSMLIGANVTYSVAGQSYTSPQFLTLNLATFAIDKIDTLHNSIDDSPLYLTKLWPLNCDGSRRVATGYLTAPDRAMFANRYFCQTAIEVEDLFCESGHAILSAPPLGLSYLWSTGQTTQQITVTDTGSYWVEVNYGCDTVRATLELTSTASFPMAMFEAQVNDLTVHFSNTSTNASTWLWNFGDGTTSTEPEPTHTYAADGQYTVMLIASNDCGSDTTSLTVEVGSEPVANFSASDTVGCAPFSVQFTNLSSANATSFQWTFEGGNPATSTEVNPVVTYSTPGTYDVKLVASNSQGSFTLIVPDYIHVLDKPVAAFSADVTDLSVSFSNASQNATSWLWNFGDGSTSTEPEPTHTYAADGQYTVMLIASNDCGSDTTSLTVEVGSEPVANFSASDTVGCAPFSVQFTNLSSANATSFQWTFEGGNPATSTEVNPVVTYSTPGTYDVKLVASNSQGSSTILYENYIHVLDEPVANFSYQTDGLTVTFTDLSAGATMWEWDFGDGQTSLEQHPVHTYAAPGEYEVLLTARNECGLSSNGQKIMVEPNATLETSVLDRFVVYPNPNEGKFMVQLQVRHRTTFDLMMVNALGQIVFADSFEAGPGLHDHPLRLLHLTAGVYYLRLHADGKTAMRKVVVVKE